MAKQLNYVLSFNADTAKARQEMQTLQRQLDELTKVASKPAGGSGLTAEFREATKAAAMLKAQVESAMNPHTGTLDLVQLNQSFKQAGVSLQSYQSKLTRLGPEGVKTFQAIAQSILSAEVPLRRSNGMLTQFATTLKNTARWQLSSSILHGFMGTLQSAYGYAKDLNESLNNIRIVTGYSTDQMAQFATEANKAAQALNTTTTNYTNASLIYYQQGLSDDVVKARTETTIKFANVARESAETASQELTAIWNNFADGADNLDYYADVLVKLGATTASSSQEISAGLQKFAAISDTIGLSYEYAAAALATVTATTRQSADVVGTAFKTLFSRLEGLQLGETLEDGTDLNKYSAALSAVGIQIKDTNGDLKDMDVILDELGGRWNTLSRDQQMALAQTVAGVRQYTQLVALMDNWDFFQQNVATARGAGGALDEQAEIYAESWEAARKRVKAAAEEIYNSLISDDFFISLNDGLAGFLGIISNVIKGLGGVRGVLFGISALVTNAFGKTMAASVDRFFNNLQGKERVAIQVRQEALTALKDSLGSEMGRAYASLVGPQQVLIDKAKNLTEQEKATAQILIEQQKLRVQNAQAAQQEKIDAEARFNAAVDSARIAARRAGGSTPEGRNQITQIAQQAQAAIPSINQMKSALEQAYQILETKGTKLTKSTIKDLFGNIDTNGLPRKVQESFDKVLQITGQTGKKVAAEFLRNLEVGLGESVGEAFAEEIEEAVQGASEKLSPDEVKEKTSDIVDTLDEMAEAGENAQELLEDTTSKGEDLEDTFNGMGEHSVTAGESIMGFAGALSSLGMIISSIKGLGDIFSDSDMSAGEKFTAVITTLGLVLPMAISGVTSLKTGIAGLSAIGPAVKSGIIGIAESLTAKATASTAAAAADELEAKASGDAAAADTAEAAASEEAAAANVAEAGAADAAAGSTLAFSAALKTVLLTIAPYVAAAATLVFIISSIAKEWGKAEEAAKRAEKTAETLAEAADNANSKLESIKSLLENYDSAVEKLNQCTKGTEDWNTALVTTKDQIDQILAKFPELLKYKNLFDENGLLNQSALKDFVDQQEKAAEAARSASYQGQAQAAQARLEADTVAAERKYTPDYYNPAHDATTSKSIRQDLNAVLGYIDSIGASAATLADVYNVLGETSQDYAYEILSLAQKSIEASNVMENANKQMIQTWADSKNKKLLQGQAEIMSKMQTDLQEQLIADAEKARAYNLRLADGFVGTSYEGKSIAEAFQQAIGSIEPVDLSEYTNEQITSTIAAAAALERLGASADTAADILNHLRDKVPEGVAEGIANFISTGSFGSMSEKDFNQMRRDAGFDWGSYLQDATGLSDKELKSILGDNYLEEVYNAVDSYGQGLQELINNLSSSVESAYNQLKASNADIEGMAPDAQAGILKTLSRAEERGGAEGLKETQDLLGKIKPDSLDEVSRILEDMNWDTQGPKEFVKAIEEAGINCGLTRDQLIQLAEGLYDSESYLQSASEKAGQLIEKLSELSDLRIGSIIDDDIFTDLSNLFDTTTLDNFVTTLSNGTHVLTGNVDELNNALVDMNVAPYLNVVLGGLSELDSKSGVIDKVTHLLGTNNQILQESANRAALCATNMDQLENIMATMQQADFGESNESFLDYTEAFSQGLLNLASQYENCTSEILKFNQALASGSDEEIVSAGHKLEMSIRAGEAAKKYEIEADAVEMLAQHYQELGQAGEEAYLSMANDPELAANAAIQNLRLDKGLEVLQQDYQDYCDILDALVDGKEEEIAINSKTLNQYKTMKKSLADIIDVNEDITDSLSPDFFKRHSDTVKKAMDGEISAINDLRDAVADEIQVDIHLSDEGNDLYDEVQDQISELEEGTDVMEIPLEINPDIKMGDYIQALTWALQQAGWGVEQIQGLFDTLNLDVDLAPMEKSLNEAIATAEPAVQDLVNTLGIDTTVNEQTATAEDRHENYNVQEFIYPRNVAISGTVMEGEGSEPKPVTISVPAFTKHVRSAPIATTTTHETTAQALEARGANTKAGGHVNTNRKGGGSGGGKKGSCFVAGTLITTKHGFRAIEKIQVGDIVLSYNESLQINEYSEVLETMIHDVIEPIYTLTIEHEILEVTGNHKLYIKRDNQYLWLPVEELTLSDKIRYANGRFQRIDEITSRIRITTVYNFEVSNNHNYYVSKSKILAHNKGGGGGGGGGKGTPAKAFKAGVGEKPTERRYHKIDQSLSQQSKSMDRVSTSLDRAYGTKRLDLFKKKVDELTKNGELLGEKYKEATDYLYGVDTNNLKEAFGDLVQFGEDGIVSNLDELIDYAMAEGNKVREQYNAWAKHQEAIGANENSDAFKEEKERMDDMLKTAEELEEWRLGYADQYRETFNLREDLDDEMAEIRRQIQDALLEEIVVKLDIRLEIKDAQDQLRDFRKKYIESFGDAITHGVKMMNVDFEQAMADLSLLPDFEEKLRLLEERRANATDDADFEKLKQEFIDLEGDILGTAEALLEWTEKVETSVPDAIDAARNRFNQFIDQLDHNATILSTIKELLALQGQTYKTQQGFTRLQQVAKAQMESQLANAILNRKWFEEAEQRLRQAESDLEGVAEDDVQYDYLKNRRDAYLAEFQEAQKTYLSSAQEAMEIAKEMFVEEIEKAVYDFGKAMTGDDLELAAEKFDHFIDTENRYLDTVNKAYQQQLWATKIQADYDKDIASTHRDLIKAFEDEYKALFNRSKINEYDLQVLEARYKVMEATIALQDAEAAKNNLRLVRDRQGNWNYQFTSNADEVAEAEQNLAEAQNEWYNIAKQQTEEVTSAIVQMWQDSQDAIQEVWTSEELTTEEKWARIAEIEEYYTQLAIDLYSQRDQSYNDLVEAGKIALGDFDTTYADTLVNMSGNADSYQQALEGTINECKNHFRDYSSTIREIAQESGADLYSLQQATERAEKATKTLKDQGLETVKALHSELDKVEAFGKAFGHVADYVHDAIDALAEMAGQATATATDMSGLSPENSLSNYAASWALIDENMVEGAAKDQAKAVLEAYRLGKYTDELTDQQRAEYGANDEMIRRMQTDSEYRSNAIQMGKSEEGATLEFLRKLGIDTSGYGQKITWSITGLDTGGYTGSWGASGKLAFLHEKELVLNAEDTNNILAAVGVVRSIEGALNSRALAMQGSMIQMLGGNLPAIAQSTEDKTITNYFDVQFPNATSSYEIEEALRNLANNADQWAERRDR